jgi:hypothetical protein
LRASPLAAEFCIKQISKYRQNQANEAGRPGRALKNMHFFEKASMTEPSITEENSWFCHNIGY